MTSVFPQFKPTSFHVSLLSRVKMNSINWSAPNWWIFIAQLVEHCSANDDAIGSNPVEAPNIFFGLKFAIGWIAITNAMIPFPFHLYSRSSYPLHFKGKVYLQVEISTFESRLVYIALRLAVCTLKWDYDLVHFFLSIGREPITLPANNCLVRLNVFCCN